MSLRERISSTLNSTHLEHGERETAIDRVHAFAHGSRLGRLLWRLKYNEEGVADEVMAILVRKLCRRWAIAPGAPRAKVAERVIRRALTEWYDWRCRTCNGRGEVMIEEKVYVCSRCKGTGSEPVTDLERMLDLMTHVSPAQAKEEWKEWEPRFREARGMILSEEGLVGAKMKVALKPDSAW